ncbi:NAD(P)H-binding protein [Nocardia vulneris]|uniref:NmrA family NAD(P)-binding protein n=1 Tax=Nocardia vulneris TaxID=1141657 RepID=UPI0005BC2E68|nr:NAD(P)H-binding protein [Nocardia vulneris]
MIIVTGATGQLGRRIVERLLARVPADRVGVSVRDPRRAQDLAERGVRVRQGSFTDPGSLAHAFEDAEQVLVVSVDKLGAEAVRQHRAAVAGAVAAGAGRILYTSHMGAAPTSRFEACRDHAADERMLRACGVPFTSLRNGFYATSAVRFLGQAAETGQLVLPADGPVSWTAHADLADAAAAILAGDTRFDGPTPPLTAAQAIDFEEIAALASELTGRTIKRVTVSDAEFHQRMLSHGVPVAQADMMVDIFAAARAGEFATVDPTLAQLIDREPTDFAAVLGAVFSAPGSGNGSARR